MPLEALPAEFAELLSELQTSKSFDLISGSLVRLFGRLNALDVRLAGHAAEIERLKALDPLVTRLVRRLRILEQTPVIPADWPSSPPRPSLPRPSLSRPSLSRPSAANDPAVERLEPLPPPKRGPGRPPGHKNVKTLEREKLERELADIPAESAAARELRQRIVMLKLKPAKPNGLDHHPPHVRGRLKQ
jgi:hypothetical protein